MIRSGLKMLAEERVGSGSGGRPRAKPAGFVPPSLERAVESVLVAGHHAIVVGSDDQLDESGRQLAIMLRASPSAQLEIYIPATAESLVGRFNQSLATLSMDAARGDASPGLAVKVLLVPDVRTLHSPEGMLLCRLVADFPGANTRLLILADHQGAEASQRVLDVLARRLERIDLAERPLGVQGAARSSRESLAPKRPLADDAPRAPSIDGLQHTPTSPDPALGSTRPGTVRQPGVIERAMEVDDPSRGAATPRPRWRTRLSWLAVFLALLLVSVLVVVLLHRDRGVSQTPGPTGRKHTPINADHASVTPAHSDGVRR